MPASRAAWRVVFPVTFPLATLLGPVPASSFSTAGKSQNHGVVQVGRDLEACLGPTPRHGQGRFPIDHVAPKRGWAAQHWFWTHSSVLSYQPVSSGPSLEERILLSRMHIEAVLSFGGWKLPREGKETNNYAAIFLALYLCKAALERFLCQLPHNNYI